jgi:23S rRNA (cytosine1962-C5)-methyltransferase
MVFSKSPRANRSLTDQFARHIIRKQYLLLTDRPVPRAPFTTVSALVRVGDKYVSRPLHAAGDRAETRFAIVSSEAPNVTLVRAEPVTGRTHQIRVHAADKGFPILGDPLYGGTSAARLHLHAAELSLRHPATTQWMTFKAAPDFAADSRLALRHALVSSETTDAYRLAHGAADGAPGHYVERLGEYLLSQSESPEPGPGVFAHAGALKPRGVYHKVLNRQVRRAAVDEASARLVQGDAAPDGFVVRENGVKFELSFREGYSVGLFLDQRDNRRRLLSGHVAANFPLLSQPPPGASGRPEMLNVFAYTCGFSVCAALNGLRATSLDLSRKYLDWGRRNFELNGLDPAAHDFLFGDAFDWLKRLARKERRFEVVVLDPPTFSQSRESGVFRAEKDYGRLFELALPLLKPHGVILASTNAASLEPERFLGQLSGAAQRVGRQVVRRHYVPQPPDFPVSREEPAYLKTVWLEIA